MSQEKVTEKDESPTTEKNTQLQQPAWMDHSVSGMGVVDDPTKINTREISVKIWESLVAFIERDFTLFHEVDSFKLSRYCDLFANWLKAKFFLEKFGTCFPQYESIIRDGQPVAVLKNMKEYPQMKQYERLSKQLSDMERDFGFEPTARIVIASTIARQVWAERRANEEHVRGRLPRAAESDAVDVNPFNYRRKQLQK